MCHKKSPDCISGKGKRTTSDRRTTTGENDDQLVESTQVRSTHDSDADEVERSRDAAGRQRAEEEG